MHLCHTFALTQAVMVPAFNYPKGRQIATSFDISKLAFMEAVHNWLSQFSGKNGWIQEEESFLPSLEMQGIAGAAPLLQLNGITTLHSLASLLKDSVCCSSVFLASIYDLSI